MCCHNNILPSTITRLLHCNSSSSSSRSSAYKPPPAEWLTTHNAFTTKQKPLPGYKLSASDAPPAAVGQPLGPKAVGGWRQQQLQAAEGSLSSSSKPGKKEGGVGGVNGDEMGLGKTCQCAGLLAGLFHTKQAKSALILAPKSVMRGWETELTRWLIAACPSVQVVVLSSEMPIARRRNIVNAVWRATTVSYQYLT
eukprot:12913-Heterococcus_DN1.PRE.3